MSDNESADTHLRVSRETRSRVKNRQRQGESYNDVIARLLEETKQPIGTGDLVSVCLDVFDNVAAIYADHIPTHAEVSGLNFWIYSGDAEGREQPLTDELTPDSTHVRVGYPPDHLDLPFDIYATFDGPKSLDSMEGTPVYMADSVVGAEYLDPDIGTAYLEQKLLQPDRWEPPQSMGMEHIYDRVEEWTGGEGEN